MASDTDIRSLTALASTWEFWEYVATLIVALACLGEYLHEKKEAPVAGSWWKRRGGTFCAKLLVAALVCETVIQVKTNRINGRVIGLLNENAEQARGEAATARLDLEQIKEKQRPRMLTAEQQSRFTDEMRGAGGLSITINAVSGDAEAFEFARQIKTTLENAGLKVNGISQMVLPGVNKGVQIRQTNPDTESPLAELLFRSFFRAGIVMDCILEPGEPNNKPLLLIGTKP